VLAATLCGHYLRKILIHGARSAVLRIKRDRAPIGAWLDALDLRAHKDVVVVSNGKQAGAHRLGGVVAGRWLLCELWLVSIEVKVLFASALR